MRLFGWKRADGTRRFRWLYLEIAKKNGKSTWLSAICLYLAIGDGEGAAEVHVNAFTRAQATIVYSEAARMVKRSPALRRRLEVLRTASRIVDPRTDSFICANSADADANDGPNASAVIFDELHRQRGRLLWEVFEYAGVARTQPLHLSVTTAGSDVHGVWHEQREYSERVNAGLIADWEHLGVVYRADPSDDIDDPETWRKANPSLGVTLSYDDFRADLAKAKETPTKLANFKRLRLNIISAAATKFLDPQRWRSLAAAFAPEEGAACYLGLDMSSRIDLTALAFLFPRGDDHWHAVVRMYLPEDRLEQVEHQHRSQYRSWAEAGHLRLCDGGEIDYEQVIADIDEACTRYKVLALGSDPMFAQQLMQQMQSAGLTVYEVRQQQWSVSGPTKDLERWAVTGKLTHDGNPVLSWCADNASVERGSAGGIRLSKSKSTGKIDGVVAIVNAIAAFLQGAQVRKSSVYERRGLILV